MSKANRGAVAHPDMPIFLAAMMAHAKASLAAADAVVHGQPKPAQTYADFRQKYLANLARQRPL